MTESAKEKVAMFCQVEKDHVRRFDQYFSHSLSFTSILKVICIADVKTLYRVPLLLEEAGIFNFVSKQLHLTLKSDYDHSMMIRWRDLTERYFLFSHLNRRKKPHTNQ